MTRAVRELKRAAKRVVIPLARMLAKGGRELGIDRWGMSVGPGGGLRYAGHDVLALARDFGTPAHLLNVERLDANLRSFQAPAASESRPGAVSVDVFYSVKTQPVPWILKRALSRGAGAEVISEYELRLALHLGAPPEKIIFNGPGKSDESIRIAIERDILLLNMNHMEEIPRVAAIARGLGRKARVGLRVTTSAGWSSQFGCSIAAGEAMAAYERARSLPELDVVGLHSHRGAQINGAAELEAYAAEVLTFADALRSRLGVELAFLDFGGSLSVPTVRPYSKIDRRVMQALFTPVGSADPDARLRPEAYVRAIAGRVEARAAAWGGRPPRVIVEPGRALTADAQALATRVMTTRASPDSIRYAVLDAGIGIAGILASERHQVFRATDAAKGGAAGGLLYRLVGPNCQPGDTVFQCVRLPELSEGDVLLIMDSGAYLEPDSTSFSFQRPPTVALEREGARVIRRRETFEDMVSRDVY